MLKKLMKENIRKGREFDATREGRLEYGVSKVKGIDSVYIRIGSTVAERAGLRPKDEIRIEYDDETGEGYLKPSPGGWALQAIGKTEFPPLFLRVTWNKDWPYVEGFRPCRRVIAKNQSLEFIFPEGTKFNGKEAEIPVSVPVELYKEHKEIVEKGRRKSRKDGHAFRRKADKAPSMRDGKPYGRREGDEKGYRN